MVGLSADVGRFLKMHGVVECGMILTGEQGNAGRAVCTSDTLYITNPIWIGLGCNLALLGDRPVTDRQTYGTAS